MELCKKLKLTPLEWADKECLEKKLKELKQCVVSAERNLDQKYAPLIDYKKQLKVMSIRESKRESLELTNHNLKNKVKKLRGTYISDSGTLMIVYL